MQPDSPGHACDETFVVVFLIQIAQAARAQNEKRLKAVKKWPVKENGYAPASANHRIIVSNGERSCN